ncbi:Uncharacterised protein [Klebsiella pneumoniae subsp. ozaenae]|uniref:Uncharacterized protein n=1 Tax=Klebsiella pneumoniae subsp. ozaenae TaxID=574 RepID=A0A378B775_KLEPO|nr:Uncharacterised protein [Klebsiella pneumoniae subsp. ozaenae]
MLPKVLSKNLVWLLGVSPKYPCKINLLIFCLLIKILLVCFGVVNINC